jgi:hypothetical protein
MAGMIDKATDTLVKMKIAKPLFYDDSGSLSGVSRVALEPSPDCERLRNWFRNRVGPCNASHSRQSHSELRLWR